MDMSNATPEPNPTLPPWAWGTVAILGVAVVVLALVASLRPVQKPRVPKGNTGEIGENNVAAARQSLSGLRDLGSCRQAVNHLNKDRIARSEEIQKLSLPKSTPEAVVANHGEYLKSVTSPGMDAWFLEECLFLREVVTAGDFQLKTRDSASGLTAATELWDWVMREVAFQDSAGESTIKAPLHWILRRGTGTAEERAVIFLALLRQSGISDVSGCLVRFTSADSPFQTLVGVLTADGKPHLFDPVVGLPLDIIPGTTFNKFVTGDWPLGDWTGKTHSRTETQGHWKNATFGIMVPLPLLAPRNNDFPGLFPEDPLAIPKVDLEAEITHWTTSLKAAGLAEPKVSLDAGELVRWPAFLPAQEGGAGNPGLAQLFSFSYVPWDLLPREVLAAHPLLARIPVQVSLGIPLPQPVGERLLFAVFAPIFRNWHETPDKGRDLLVRFQFSRVVPELKQEKEEVQGRIGKAFTETEKGLLRGWINDANTAYANLARNPGNPAAEEGVKALWERSGPMLMAVLIPASIARMEEIQVALALAKHEQASQMTRKLAKKIPGITLADTTRAWRAAAEGWAQLASDSKIQWEAKAHLSRYLGEALRKSGNLANAREIWKRQGESGRSPDSRACAILAKVE